MTLEPDWGCVTEEIVKTNLVVLHYRDDSVRGACSSVCTGELHSKVLAAERTLHAATTLSIVYFL